MLGPWGLILPQCQGHGASPEGQFQQSPGRPPVSSWPFPAAAGTTGSGVLPIASQEPAPSPCVGAALCPLTCGRLRVAQPPRGTTAFSVALLAATA